MADSIADAIARITLGGGYGGGYGGYAGSEPYTASSPFTTPTTGGAAPSVYTPQFDAKPTVDQAVTGGVGGMGGFGNFFKDWNTDKTGLVLGGLQTIGSLWGAWQANKLANEQFKFSKDFALKNLSNQTTAYNTELEGRTRARAFTEGLSDQDAKNYVEAHRLAQM
jgi:hypothetical protein